MLKILYTTPFVLLCIHGCSRNEPIANNPNVLFIVIDDMLPALGCYGNLTIQSPNIDQLSRNGTMFTNAFCQVAICNPSRSSVMTGLRPDNIKVWTNSTFFRKTNPDVVTLPQFFKNNGYAAREVGKIFHDPAAFKDSCSWSGPSFFSVTQNGRGHKYNLPENCEPFRSHGTATESADVQDSAYIDGKVCQAAINLLRELKDSAFFLAVGFRRPHLPFSVPKKYWDLYSRKQFEKELKDTLKPLNSAKTAFHNSEELRGYEDIPADGIIPWSKQLELLHGYYASISYVDEQIGKLLNELKGLCLSENTIIVLWSDQGYHLGDFGLWGKTTDFEAAARVALIFAGPDIAKGYVNSSIVELLDIYPTLLDLAHFQKNPALEGKSLVHMLKKQVGLIKGDALSQIARPYQDAVNSGNPGIMGYSLRTPEYRYNEWRSFPDMSVIEKELYKLGDSHTEKENIAGKMKYDKIIEELSKEIDSKRK